MSWCLVTECLGVWVSRCLQNKAPRHLGTQTPFLRLFLRRAQHAHPSPRLLFSNCASSTTLFLLAITSPGNRPAMISVVSPSRTPSRTSRTWKNFGARFVEKVFVANEHDVAVAIGMYRLGRHDNGLRFRA